MSVQEFREFRERLNQRILEADNLAIRRFFALDTQVYHDGALDDARIFDTFSVGLVVGGSIVIPHLRRAVDTLDELRAMAARDHQNPQ